MAGNSWQQPVAGEPSWGTFHTHFEELVNTDPSSTGDQTVTCTNAPTGTNGIVVRITISSATTAGRYVDVKDSSGNIWYRCANPSTAIGGRGETLVPLNASKQFLWSVPNVDVSSVILVMLGYYI